MVGLLVATIVLIVVCLVVRGQTEFQLSRLRTQLMALRMEEKRLAQEHAELEQMIAQIGEALGRGDRRRQVLREDDQELTNLLRELYQQLKGEELDLDLLNTPREPQQPPVEPEPTAAAPTNQ